MQPQEKGVRMWEVTVRPGQANPGPEEQDGAQALAPAINTEFKIIVEDLNWSKTSSANLLIQRSLYNQSWNASFTCWLALITSAVSIFINYKKTTDRYFYFHG